MNTKHYLNILYSVLFVFSTYTFQLNAQTLTVGQVYSYQAGDVICTRIDNGDFLPYYSVDTIVSRVQGSDQITFIKRRTEFTYQVNSRSWKGISYRDTYTVVGLNNPYFNGFLINDTISIAKDSNDNIISLYEFKDSAFTGPCGKTANYNRFHTLKSGKTTIQTTTVYQGLGVFIHYEERSRLNTLVDERLQFSVLSGTLCGDSTVMSAFRETSVKSFSNALINIYPNPCTDIIHTGITEPFKYKIYNLQGQLISTSSGTDGSISAENLNSGLYIIEITVADKNYTCKILRE